MNEKLDSENFRNLRQRAEEKLRRQLIDLTSDPENLSVDDVRRLALESQVHQVELEMQNDELRRVQDELETSRENYFNLYDLAPVGYFTINANGMILEANLTAAKMLGSTRDHLINAPLGRFVHPADRDAHYHYLKNLFCERPSRVTELRMTEQEGSFFWAHLESIISDTKDKTHPVCLTIMTDISHHKQYEDQIRTALAEREVLLKEIHHRVKNNLTMLISLINMQMESVKDPRILALFGDLQDRLATMALMHEQLYQREDLKSINFGSFLMELTDRLHAALAKDPTTAIRLKLTTRPNVQGIFLDINQAIPCGLIVNELVTNALKHAFPHPNPRDEVIVTFKDSEHEWLLTVSDNGIGMPSWLNWRMTETLGLKLVNAWVIHQLRGSLAVESKKGTTFTIKIPKQE